MSGDAGPQAVHEKRLAGQITNDDGSGSSTKRKRVKTEALCQSTASTNDTQRQIAVPSDPFQSAADSMYKAHVF